MRTDYHLHSAYSIDSEMSMEALCEAAIAAGLSEICLTEHTDFGAPNPLSDVALRTEEWLADIERMRGLYPSLTIRAGIEVGDNPACRERIKAWHAALPLDFLLLSLHLVDNLDPYLPEYFEGRSQDAAYRAYVEAKLESILAWEPEEFDSMAHLGFCAKFAPYPPKQRPLRYRHAPDHFDALFARLAQGGKAMEINTSGRRTMGEFIPDRELIERFVACGGEFVTLGSDAHFPEHVGNWIDEARMLAKACGVRYAVTYERRRPIPVRL